MPGQLLIRADSRARMGAGHVMRSLALAQVWRARGGQATFLSCCESGTLRQRIETAGITFLPLKDVHPQPIDLATVLSVAGAQAPKCVVLDGYNFGSEYQRTIRAAGHQLMVIDDTAHLPAYDADVLLNQNIYADQLAYPCNADTTLLLGTRYALLRTEFLTRHNRPPARDGAASKLLVSLGGEDAEKVTLKVVRALSEVDAQRLQVRVVVGPANPHLAALRQAVGSSRHSVELIVAATDMAELMTWADVAVTAAGSTCWELAFMGLPAVVLQTADNQRAIAETLDRLGIVRDLGAASTIAPERIAAELGLLLSEYEPRLRMSQMGRAAVDGRGAERVVAVLTHGSEDAFSLRSALSDDAFMLWQWANDPATRANSFEGGAIPWETHREWYATKLSSPTTCMWILEYRGAPVGQIRYQSVGRAMAEISFSVAPAYRGRGLGTRLLEMSVPLACGALNVRSLRGTAFVNNQSSQRAFNRAGFRLAARETVSGRDCCVFQWDCVVGEAHAAVH